LHNRNYNNQPEQAGGLGKESIYEVGLMEEPESTSSEVPIYCTPSLSLSHALYINAIYIYLVQYAIICRLLVFK